MVIYDASVSVMMLTFEPTDKINQILWCNHFEDNEKQYLGNEVKF